MTEQHADTPDGDGGTSHDEADRALLATLAFAEGDGLPLPLWAALVQGLTGQDSIERDVLACVDRSGSRLVETERSAGPVYRLRDPDDATRLRAAGPGTDDGHHAPNGPDGPDGEQETHRLIAVTLLTGVPRDARTGRRDWSAADPYVVQHLATYAAAGGVLDQVLEDAEYLVHAVPDTLLCALNSLAGPGPAARRNVYRTSAHRYATATISERRDVLAIDAARHGQPDLARELSRGRPWRPRWATGTMAQPALRLAHTGFTTDAAACTRIDGRPVAVTADCYGTVRVWDLADGSERLVLQEPPGVYALDCVDIDGRPHAVTGSSEGTVRVWDLVSGTERAVLTGHKGWVRAVACTVIDGRPHAVSAGTDHVVRVWDLTDGMEQARMLGHTDEVRAVACTRVAGRPVAVTAGYDTTVRVWDLTDGTERAVLTGHTSAVYGAACAIIDELPHAVTVAVDGTGRVWCLTDGSERAVLTGHLSWGLSVACVDVDGRPHAVTGSGDRTARLWDLTDGTERAVLTGHRREVDVVACIEVDGRPYAVTGGHSAPPRVWDLSDTTAEAAALEGHSWEVAAVRGVTVDGRPHAVTTGGRTLRLWDVAEGKQRSLVATNHWDDELACTVVDGRLHALGAGCCKAVPVWDVADGTWRRDLPGHEYKSRVAACLDIDGRPHAVTSDWDRDVRVWDLADDSGGPVHTSRTRSSIRSLAPVTIDGRSHLVTGADDGGLRVWRFTRTGRPRTTLTVNTSHRSIRALAVTTIGGSPHAVTVDGFDRVVRVWDLADGTERAALTGHDAGVIAVACGELDGRPYAVTVDNRHTAYLWDLTDQRLQERIALPTSAQAVAFAGPDLVLGMGSDVVTLTRNDAEPLG